MAASLVRSVFGVSAKKSLALRTTSVCQTWTRTAFFRRGKDKEAETAAVDDTADQAQLAPASSLSAATRSLRKREGLQTVRSYMPPADVEQRVQGVVSLVCGHVDDWTAVRLDDNRVKFKILDGVMRACDHAVPNTALVEIRTVRDVVAFFSTPVRDTTAYQDLATQDLPPNLHIQLEPLRFDPETDTMFGGVTAFPDRPTMVTSLKYKRKYGNNQK